MTPIIRTSPTLLLVGAVFAMLAVSGKPVSAQIAPPDAPSGESVSSTSIRVPLVVTRVEGTITVDGIVDEAAWAAIEPLPMTVYAPTFGAQPSELSEIRVAHDEEYLYVSGRLYDSERDLIRTNTLYRDKLSSSDDLMGVIVDSFNDYQTAVWFSTNPAGVRSDRTVANDADFSSGSAMNVDWNAHWTVETSQNDEGWSAEFRIPFSTLGFQDVDGEVTMGLIVYRTVSRRNERQLYPAIEPNWGGLSFAKPSQAQRIVLRGVRGSKPVYVTPYTVNGVTRTPSLNGDGGGPARWDVDSDPINEIGLDVKYSPSSNLTLDVTANTDFAQVEVDNQQVNLTRFSLFFPEKRQFFQERASTFDFSMGGRNRLFHSRQIGLVDGDFVRIYGGTRLVGRAGGMDFGMLNMQTASHDGTPAENMGVVRLNQRILNDFSSIGAMVTTRLGSGGQDNVAYGVDGVVRPFGDEYVIVKWAQSFDEVIDERSTFGAGLIRAEWQRRNDDGFSYTGSYTRTGADYRPGLGFQSRTDNTRYGGNLQYKRFQDATSRFRSVALSTRTEHIYRNADTSAESRSIAPQLQIEFKTGAQITLSGSSKFESVRNAFNISDARIPIGEYWFHDGSLRLQLPRNGLFRGDVTVSAGSFYDGRRWGMAVNPTWSVSRYLEFGGGYDLNRLSFDDRGESTTIHQGRLRVEVSKDTHLSVSTFLQYNSSADIASINARVRYHFTEGTDLWVVYNEGLNTARDNGLDPRLLLSAGRSFMIKYNHVLIW